MEVGWGLQTAIRLPLAAPSLVVMEGEECTGVWTDTIDSPGCHTYFFTEGEEWARAGFAPLAVAKHRCHVII